MVSVLRIIGAYPLDTQMSSRIVGFTGKSIFRMKASPGRGKLSPQVTDEGAGKQLLPGNYPSSGATRHLFPLLSLYDIFPRPGEICPQGVKALALGQAAKS